MPTQPFGNFKIGNYRSLRLSNIGQQGVQIFDMRPRFQFQHYHPVRSKQLDRWQQFETPFASKRERKISWQWTVAHVDSMCRCWEDWIRSLSNPSPSARH